MRSISNTLVFAATWWLSGVVGDPVSAQCSTFVRGDADGSGSVTYTADFDYIMAYLFTSGPAPDPLDSGDANDDGVINTADASYLANYNSSGPAPLAPFPTAGYDPTPDTLEPECDAILSSHSLSLTSYLPSSATSIQDIRPLVTQRGVMLDGSPHAGSGPRFHLAGNSREPRPPRPRGDS